MPNYKYGRTLRERVLSRLMICPDGCLVWTGHCDDKGYGRVQAGTGRPQKVHRVTYQMFVGPIPAGLELDHLCRVKRCGSPAHLEPVTHAENMRRTRKVAV